MIFIDMRIRPIPMKFTTPKRLKQLERNFSGKAYQEWRKYVLTRDGHKCQFPGCEKIENLEVHHIVRFADSASLRHSTRNGITLCKKHHKGIHGCEKRYAEVFFMIALKNEKDHKDAK